MTLFGILALMIVTFVLGKSSPRLGAKQYLAIILITLIQVGIALYQLFTMRMPPLR